MDSNMENTATLPERPKNTKDKSKKAKAEKKPAKEPQASKPDNAPPPPKEKVPSAPVDPDSMFKEGFLASVYREKPSERVITRFPPEPNGFLHIGHSKAIAINFGFARHYGGDCYLRYDDTNPEAEDERYVRSIREMVEWLGFRPFAITYSSDYFDELYRLAEDLIGRDGAYVCHCTDAELKLHRGGENNRGPRYACPHRTRPTEESLDEFRAMRDGKYKPKEAFLRMKQDIHSGNTRMWDLAAYRILNKAHHRTGDKWRIYPTYDFTHCIADSKESITHSLCTTEFETSRESYEWLCDALDIYKPMQREYGRLKIEGTVLSKRLIQKLIEANVVRDFDDPQLFTLVGLRRRGVPPGAILSFVSELGVSTATSEIQIVRFEASIRRYLEQTVPRLMLILDPIPVIIDDLPEDHLEEIEVPFSPKHPEFGTHVVPFTRTVFIDRSDFREVDSKDYFRLAPGKAVGLLKVPFPIRATAFTKDPESGLVVEVRATYDRPKEGEPFKKPKTYIQWVAASAKHNSPVKAEVRFFHNLLNPPTAASTKPPKKEKKGPKTTTKDGDDPAQPTTTTITTTITTTLEINDTAAAAEEQDERRIPITADEEATDGLDEVKEDGKTAFLKDINLNSEEIFPNAVVEIGLDEVRRRAPWPEEGGERKGAAGTNAAAGPETVRFQGLRVAYFCMDQESSVDGKVVLNRIVGIKEDAGKGV